MYPLNGGGTGHEVKCPCETETRRAGAIPACDFELLERRNVDKIHSGVLRRFCQVLEQVYGGDLGRLAIDIGVDRSTCSRYRSGKTKLTRRSLQALSVKAQVNSAWLEKGGSDSIVWDIPDKDNWRKYALPVFVRPLHDPPSNNPWGRTSLFLAVPPGLESCDRYWLQIDRDNPTWGALKGDFILLEYCRGKAVLSDYEGKLAAFKREDGQVILGTVPLPSCRGDDCAIYGRAILLYRDLEGAIR